MANPNPSPGTRIKKGQVLNPGGKPKGALTTEHVKAVMGKFCNKTKQELSDVVKDPKATMLEIMVASIMAKAASGGDYNRLAFLLDRSVGKVKEEISAEIKTFVLPTLSEAKAILESDLSDD